MCPLLRQIESNKYIVTITIMASTSSKMKEKLSCQICFMEFNMSDRIPKTFDCHHTVCLSCIEGLIKGCNKGEFILRNLPVICKYLIVFHTSLIMLDSSLILHEVTHSTAVGDSYLYPLLCSLLVWVYH